MRPFHETSFKYLCTCPPIALQYISYPSSNRETDCQDMQCIHSETQTHYLWYAQDHRFGVCLFHRSASSDEFDNYVDDFCANRGDWLCELIDQTWKDPDDFSNSGLKLLYSSEWQPSPQEVPPPPFFDWLQ